MLTLRIARPLTLTHALAALTHAAPERTDSDATVRSRHWLLVVSGSILLAALLGGCAKMTDEEIAEASRACERAGLQPTAAINGFTMDVSEVRCVPREYP